MSINDEFIKMDITSTNPMAAINEVYVVKNGKLTWDSNPEPIDVDVVEPDPIPSIHIPTSITQPAKETTLGAITKAFNLADSDTRNMFIKKLIFKIASQDQSREGFKDILRAAKLIESVTIPEEQVAAPEATKEQETDVSFRDMVEELKNIIEDKKGSGDMEKEKAYDDITSAFDLILHHLSDIKEA